MGPAPPTCGVTGLSGWSSTLLSPACSRASLQLTETSSRYARKISGTTALQEALKEKHTFRHDLYNLVNDIRIAD